MEPTQQARPYFNPYETTMQSDPYGVPIIPPPPPREKHGKTWLLWSIIVVIVVASLTIASFIGVQYYSHNEHKSMATVAPTTVIEKTVIIETPTDVPTTPTIAQLHVPYMADEIVRDFIQSNIYSMEGGADGSGIHPDYQWECCTYKPEGGAYYWLDCGSCGSGGPVTTVDLATFASGYETQLDASQLNNENFRTSVIGDCLLSYEQNTPDYSIMNYVNVMQEYCY